MTNYKFHLRKSSAKEICPNCGRKTFVPYVDANECIVGEEFGRCDREQKCGYFRYPHGVASCATSEPIVDERPRLQFYEIAKTFGNNGTKSNLFLYALCAFHSKAVARIAEFFEVYNIRTWQDFTIFPQIDQYGAMRSAKMIKYNDDGHRKHEEGASTWLHALKAFRHLHNGGKLEQCFFGEHLLNPDNYLRYYGCKLTADTPIFVVESEKTALMMACHSYNVGVWLACGGAQMLKNPERNKVLEGRNVTLIPDRGQFWNWKSTAYKYGWKILDIIEQWSWVGFENFDPPSLEGCDIWDIYEFLISKNDENQ